MCAKLVLHVRQRMTKKPMRTENLGADLLKIRRFGGGSANLTIAGLRPLPPPQNRWARCYTYDKGNWTGRMRNLLDGVSTMTDF
jgi:hypothetical protein